MSIQADLIVKTVMQTENGHDRMSLKLWTRATRLAFPRLQSNCDQWRSSKVENQKQIRVLAFIGVTRAATCSGVEFDTPQSLTLLSQNT